MLELVSMDTVKVNDWMVKASIVNSDTICVILYHYDSERTIVKYFDDEEEAYRFITSLTSRTIDDSLV